MKARFFTLGCITVLGYAAAAWGQVSANEIATNRQSGRSCGDVPMTARLSDDSARAVLLKVVSEVRWDEVPFEEVIEWLNRVSEDRVNVNPRWAPLSTAGVDRDSTVTLQFRNVTVAHILNETMDQLSDTEQITYHAMGNILQISTKVDFDRTLYWRTYDVRDILVQVPDFGRSAPQIDLEQAARGGGAGSGGQSPFTGASSSTDELEQDESKIEDRLSDLLVLIMDIILPESWAEETGGPRRVRIFDNRTLVVRAPIEVHEQLAGFFAFER